MSRYNSVAFTLPRIVCLDLKWRNCEKYSLNQRSDVGRNGRSCLIFGSCQINVVHQNRLKHDNCQNAIVLRKTLRFYIKTRSSEVKSVVYTQQSNVIQ